MTAKRAAAWSRWCEECQREHTFDGRARILRRLLPESAVDLKQILQDEYACIFGYMERNSAAARRLIRDLHKLGAEFNRATYEWSLR